MGENLKFDYYYGIEAEQFSFYRVPRLLIKDARFKGLSSDAKLLYGLMLDRMSHSMKNGWVDEDNRAYIIYAVDSIMEDLGCSKPTCVKIMRELDSDNGMGLIEKKRRGLGKPDIIYVKNFATIQDENPEKEPSNTDESTEVKNFNFRKSNSFTSGSKESLPQEVKEFNFWKERNLTSGGKEILPQEVKNLSPNYTNLNYTDMSYNNPIYQSGDTDTGSVDNSVTEPETDMIDTMDETTAYMELIKENIEYDFYKQHGDYRQSQLIDEFYDIICDVVCVKRKTIRIGREDYPYEMVKSRFLKINSGHIEYVMGCLERQTDKINNIRAYLITTLYNAPSTMNNYFNQEVQHDMHGGGWIEKGVI